MSSTIKILVVEDERIIAVDIQNSLEKLGYGITNIVSTGQAALSEVEKNPPDIILMDIVLNSKMSGTEVADKIKNKYDIPVIYLTAYADMQTLEKAKLTEPYGYIIKPFNMLELQSTLEMALYKYNMEKKLKRRNTWISSVLGSIADGVIATDKKSKVTFVNYIAEDLIGISRDKIIGQSITEVLYLIDEKTGEALKGFGSKLFEDKNITSLSRTAVLLSKTGSYIPVDTSIAPIKNDKGIIEGVVTVFRDITERRRAEKNLEVSEKRYRGLFEAMHSGVIYFNKNKKIISCNNSAAEIFEVNSSELIGSKLSNRSWQLLNEYGVKLIQQDNPVDIAFSTGVSVLNKIIGLITPEGQKRWLLTNATPVYGENKKEPESLFMIITNITQRKEMEFTLKARNLELEALNTIAHIVSSTLDLKTIVSKALDEILRIMDFSKGCVFIYNEEGKKIAVNVFRNISKELSKAFVFYHQDDTSIYRKQLNEGDIKSFLTKEILKGNNYKSKNEPEESSLYCLLIPLKAGNTIIGSLNLFNEKLLSSQDFGYYFFSNVGIQIGLTVRNARLFEKTNYALKELRITQDKLVESEKLVGFGEMASSVVHEIGNPLGSISNSIQILQKKLNVDGTMKELMNIIDWESERLTKSVEQLRELSKQRSYNFKKCDLRDIVRRGLLIINKDFELVMGKDIETHFSKNLPMVNLDSDAMQQVIFNLVKNALQSIEEGKKIEVRIKSISRQKVKHLVLEIKDYGKGMSEECLQSIFEPYFTTKSKGMGLGMHVVKQIVEAHNGDIEITSKENVGTTVTILLPVKGVGND